MLAMLVGCGLRRVKLLSLGGESIQLREEHSLMADRPVKTGHIRIVPIPDLGKAASDNWKKTSGVPEGARFRSINKIERPWGGSIPF
jgi:hypothetical protein